MTDDRDKTEAELRGLSSPGNGGEERPSEPEEKGVAGPKGLVNTLRLCLLSPLVFFSWVKESDDRWSAMSHAVVMHAIGFSLAAGWTAILEPEELTISLIRVVIAPIWVLVSVWVGSEMMHGWLGLLRGTSRSRSVTHRAVAFCYSTAIFGVIPQIPIFIADITISGLQLGLFAAAVYQIIALRQVHQTETWKAILAVLLTWGVLLGGIVLLFLASAPPELLSEE